MTLFRDPATHILVSPAHNKLIREAYAVRRDAIRFIVGLAEFALKIYGLIELFIYAFK